MQVAEGQGSTERGPVLQRFLHFAAGHEIWPVALAAAAGMLSERLLPLSVAVAGVFWLVRRAARGHFTRRTLADLPVLVLVLLLPVTLCVTIQPEKTLPQVLRLLSGTGLYYALVNWADRPARLRLAAWGLILAGAVLALAAPLTVSWNSEKFAFIPAGFYEHFPPLITDTANPNVMAGSLVILLPLAAGLILFSWRICSRFQRFLLCACALLMAGVLVLTQSRGALLGMAASLAVLAGLRWRRGWLLLPAGAGASLAAAFVLGLDRALQFLSGATSLGGWEGRVEVWSRAAAMIRDFPLSGIGMGTFTQVADRLYPFFQYRAGTVEHAHNLFLQVAVDLGLPGLLAWLAVLVLSFLAGWETYRVGKGNFWGPGSASSTQVPVLLAGLGAGLLAAQSALVVHGLLDAVTWGMVRPAPLVWALWGLACSAGLVVHLPGSER